MSDMYPDTNLDTVCEVVVRENKIVLGYVLFWYWAPACFMMWLIAKHVTDKPFAHGMG